MKNLKKSWMLAAILICGACLVGCGNKTAKEENGVENVQTEVEVQAEPQVPEPVLYDVAINDYLVNVIGKNYAEAEYCIPCPLLVSTDDGNKDHPGLMHLKKTGNGYEVTSFEAVEDGAGNMESAKRIFGDKYDSFWEINSHQEKREDFRLHCIANYVKAHNIPAKMVQDYGWPAVELPK